MLWFYLSYTSYTIYTYMYFILIFREMKEGSPSEREDEGGGGLFTNPDLALQVCKEDYRNNIQDYYHVIYSQNRPEIDKNRNSLRT